MYASCTKTGCRKPSTILVDLRANDGSIRVHTRCQQHIDVDSFDAAGEICSKKNHKRCTMPLSDNNGNGDTFHANCQYHKGIKAKSIIRFEDGLGATTTEARCSECLKKIRDNPANSGLQGTDRMPETKVKDLNITSRDLK